jgi:hypothetical protein
MQGKIGSEASRDRIQNVVLNQYISCPYFNGALFFDPIVDASTKNALLTQYE